MRRRSLLAGGMFIQLLPMAIGASERAVLADVYGDQSMQEGRVALTLPALAENGNSVAMTVEAESPMTNDDFVRSIRIFAPANPVPNIGDFHFSPASGRARLATRIRLSDTQTVTAVAEMNDGSLFAGAAKTIVTLAACIEPLI